MDIISQGAEAILKRDGELLYKERISKQYRIENIDVSLRKSRTKREIKVLKQAKELGISVPEIYDCDDQFTVLMDYKPGVRLRDRIEEQIAGTKELEQIGKWIATLHGQNIIHGDLTTSNVLMTEENALFLIDFGLSIHTMKIEDRAVDIHLLEQALESTHYKNKEELFEAFLKGYSQSKNYEEVIQRLNIVRSRGRNKN